MSGSSAGASASSGEMRSERPAKRRLLGKVMTGYTIEQLRKLCQDFKVKWTKNDNKTHLFNKLLVYSEKHPKLTAKDRMDILDQPMDPQYIRYQFIDPDDGLPTDSTMSQGHRLLNRQIFRQFEQEFDGTHPTICKSCNSLRKDIEYPSVIGVCCGKASTMCRTCVVKILKRKIDAKDATTDQITCPMCSKSMTGMDVKALLPPTAYDKYAALKGPALKARMF